MAIQTPTTHTTGPTKAHSSTLSEAPSPKRFRTLQAVFAMRGRELVRSVRADDGRVSYIVTRAGDSRHFSHWNDLEAHLRAIQ